MKTAARTFAFALTTALTFGQLQAAEPVRGTPAKEGSDAPATSINVRGNNAVLERELFRQMDRYVVYPVMTNDKNLFGDVVVDFVIDAVGRVEVIDLQASNPALGAYVRAKLAKVDVGDNPEGTWNTSHVRFRFRPQA